MTGRNFDNTKNRRNGDILIAELAIKIDSVIDLLKERTQAISKLQEDGRTHLSNEHVSINQEITKTRTIVWIAGAILTAVWTLIVAYISIKMKG